MGIYLSVVALTIALITVSHPDNAWPLALIFVAGAGFVTLCLTALAWASEVRCLPKWGWAVFCAVSVPLGGIIYLSIGRVRGPRRTSAGRAGHADASSTLPDASTNGLDTPRRPGVSRSANAQKSRGDDAGH